MRTLKRTIAVALILSADGKIFQGQKDLDQGGVYCDGYWHIPGGGVEVGENAEQTLKREVKEEAGLQYELIDDQGTGEADKTLTGGEKVRVKMRFYIYKIVLPIQAAEAAIELSDDLFRY